MGPRPTPPPLTRFSRLLNDRENAKTAKGEKLEPVLSLILHLAPADTSGVLNVCPGSTPGCRADCLAYSGHGGIFTDAEPETNAVLRARIRRTVEYAADPVAFVARLAREIRNAVKRAAKRGRDLTVRINGTSDLPKVALELAAMFPDVQFYDYTKLARAWERTRPNYHLTFSRSESNDAECFNALAHGVNVAVAFDVKPGQPLPLTYFGVTVIDGDTTDLRYLDRPGVVVGLRWKRPTRRKGHKATPSAFVVRVADLPAADRATLAA
jgi:hypothetical protein